MNDYLSNLVGKALNRLPVVRPERAPLFAPSPYTAGAFGASPPPQLADEAREEDETLLDAPTDARGPRVTSPTFRRDADETQGSGARGRERRAAPHAEGFDAREVETRRSGTTEAGDAPQAAPALTPRPLREETAQPGALTPRGEEHTAADASAPRARTEADGRRARRETDEPAESLAPVRDAARATEAAIAELRRRVGRDEEGVGALERELESARAGARGLFGRDPSRAGAASPSSSESDAGASDRGRARRREPRDEANAAPTPHVKPRSVAPAPQVRPVSVAPAPRPAAAERVEAPPPQPTIQVTIGRIEVRATPQPAPARRTAAPAPRLSLEEYLQRRSGGGR